ncbi:malate synthase [Shewanella algae]|uniref:malate synthase n=1 Tax=Shewanella algae TaxID=38313 RepID=UPI000D1BCD05|nr:malate synthase [Shewanella algae]PSS73677.1 hypothetical protein AYI88_07095 [Shewanella algae]
MNISTMQQKINQEHNPFIAEAVFAVEALGERHIADKMANAKQLLDRLFPLANGSHAEVVCYVVYYQHLLACFADGSQCGLKQPQQFVALSGHRSEPEAILLKDDCGCHLELSFDRQGCIGSRDCAAIEDIQLERCLIDGRCQDNSLKREWISLLHNDGGQPRSNKSCKRFTTKDGQEYQLSSRV